jgi:hypothetical protein
MPEMAGLFGHEEPGLRQIRGPLTIDVLVGMGGDRDKLTPLDAGGGDGARRRGFER